MCGLGEAWSRDVMGLPPTRTVVQQHQPNPLDPRRPAPTRVDPHRPATQPNLSHAAPLLPVSVSNLFAAIVMAGVVAAQPGAGSPALSTASVPRGAAVQKVPCSHISSTRQVLCHKKPTLERGTYP